MAHLRAEIVTNLLQRKRCRMRVQWLCNSVQLLLFCSSERSLMALGINGKVISRAYALGPAWEGRGLCATVCPPTWAFVCVRADAHVYTHSTRPPTTGEPDWQPKDPERGANTRANKRTLAQSELRVSTRLCQQLCSKGRLPPGSPTSSEHSNRTILMFNSIFSLLFACVPCSTPISLINPRLWGVNFIGCKPGEGVLTTVSSPPAHLFEPTPPPHAFKTVHITAWCNAAAGASKAGGHTASGAGSNSAGK